MILFPGHYESCRTSRRNRTELERAVRPNVPGYGRRCRGTFRARGEPVAGTSWSR
jgi:hypothetical protein